jgi:hypothetical protein
MDSEKISALISLASTLVILIATYFQWWDISYNGTMATKKWVKVLFMILIVATLASIYFLVK